MTGCDLSIIIVNWNAGTQLLNCVKSITLHGDGLVRDVIVVDNGSTDGSDASIEAQPNVTLIRTGANLGFGKACNLGAQQATGEYLLFLNPDAAVHPGTLQSVLAFMQDPANSQVGICGVQLLDDSGQISRSCTRIPSAISLVMHAVGVDRVMPRLGHFMAEWDHKNTRQVDHVIGAFYLVRHQVFRALHGFDEQFFVYLEDLDFSCRAHQLGWTSVYLTEAQAFHAGGGTSNQVKARRLFYSLRSRLLYAFKHFSWIGATAVTLATLLVEPFTRSGLALIRRSWTGLREIWVAYGLLWRWLPRWAFKGETR